MPRGAREFFRPLFAQRLVDLVGVLIQRRRQVSPSFRRLTVGRPLRIRAATGTLGGLLPEKSRHLLVGAAIGIGEQAVVDLLRQRHPVGGHQRGRWRIREVEEQEVDEVDREAPAGRRTERSGVLELESWQPPGPYAGPAPLDIRPMPISAAPA